MKIIIRESQYNILVNKPRDVVFGRINEDETKSKTDEFIIKAQKVHQNPDGTPKYNYNKTNYIGSKERVIITCPKHNYDFYQTPNTHLFGSGCPICSKESRNEKNTMTGEEFIGKAQKLHKNPDGTPKYNYDKTKYISAREPVVITCPIHNYDFKQIARTHLHRSGCPICGSENRHKKRTHSTEEFIKIAQKVHQKPDGTPKYGYDNVNYINNNTKVIITCPTHGNFPQLPCNHKRGVGCPYCNESKGEKTIKEILEQIGFIDIPKSGEYRINKCKNSLTCQQYKFDIFLPYNENNYLLNKNIPKTGIIFEYDGIQHFDATDFHGGEIEFKKRVHRDKEKNLYCKNNNIKLVRIPYTSKTKEDITRDIEFALNNSSTFILTGDYPKAGWNK